MVKEILSAAIPNCVVEVVALTALAGACLGGCHVPPNVVQGGVAGVELAICIANTWVKDKSAGKSDGDAIADCITVCGTDAATVARVIDSDTKFAVFYKPKAECK